MSGVDVDEKFFHKLTAANGLTKLEFGKSARRRFSRSLLSQVNLLGSLIELKLKVSQSAELDRVFLPEKITEAEAIDCPRDSGSSFCTAQKIHVLWTYDIYQP